MWPSLTQRNTMKDFIIAEYKTIILVLLFCGGIFMWFYNRELSKEKAKAEAKAWVYTCLEPGKRVGDFTLGSPAPALDDRWEVVRDVLPGMTVWRQSQGGIVLNVSPDNTIRTIELYPDEANYDACNADFEAGIKGKSPTSSIKVDGTLYIRYAGIQSVSRLVEEEQKVVGWIVTRVQ